MIIPSSSLPVIPEYKIAKEKKTGLVFPDPLIWHIYIYVSIQHICFALFYFLQMGIILNNFY